MSTGNVGQVTSNTQQMNAGCLYSSEIFTAGQARGDREQTRGYQGLER